MSRWHCRVQRGVDTGPQTKVAIVGTGMAGLVTAYLLSRDEQTRYAVTLFEKVCTIRAPQAATVSTLADQT